MSAEPMTPKMDSDDEMQSPVKRAASEDHPDSSPSKAPRTPKKKAAAAPKTPKAPRTPKTPRTPGTGRAGGNAIPATWEEAGEADRLIFKMKEDGKKAKEIKTAYEKLVGRTVGDSTLSVRVARLKAAWERLEAGDDAKLLAALETFDEERASFEKSKFQRLAVIMESKGTKKYTTMLLEKEFKRIMEAKAAGTFIPSNADNEDEDEDDDEAVEEETEELDDEAM